MASQSVSSTTTGRGRTGRRPYLAGGLLIGANLIDVVAISPLATVDLFFVVTRNAIYQLDITGWVWLHLTVAAAATIAGVLVMSTERGWVIPLGAGCAASALAIGTVLLPYAPLRVALVIPANAAAIWLLIRHRRAQSSG
jgi:hypothetical protein